MKTNNFYKLFKHVRRMIQPKMEGAHKKLRRWYTKYGLENLFLKKYLLIPLNKKKEHWSLVIVCNLPNLLKTVTSGLSLDSLPKHEQPMILYLDSLLQVDDQIVFMLRMYLESELKSILGDSYSVNEKDDSEAGINYLVDEHSIPCHQLLVNNLHSLLNV